VTSRLGTGKSPSFIYSVAITWIKPVLLLTIIHDLTIVADLLHIGTVVVETHVTNEKHLNWEIHICKDNE
jgi:hypothetical protein